MGNHQIRAMQEQQYQMHGNKNGKVSKKQQQLELIHNRLQLKNEYQVQTKSNSQTRSTHQQNFAFDDSQQKQKAQNKIRNVTPTTEGLSQPTGVSGAHITSLSKTFGIENNLENKKKDHHRNTSIMNSSADSIKSKLQNQQQFEGNNRSYLLPKHNEPGSLQVQNQRLGERLKTMAQGIPNSTRNHHHLQNSLPQSNSMDPFSFEQDQQQLFDQLLDGQDPFSLNSKYQNELLNYYRKGSNPSDHGFHRAARTSRGNRKMSDQSNSKNLLGTNITPNEDQSSSQELDSNKNHTPTRAKNKFAARMAKYMNHTAHSPNITLENCHNCNSQKNSSSGHDESSSSRSSKLNSQRSNLEGESLGVQGFQFSQIPAMSFDGMQDGYDDDGGHRTQTTETEEEEGVIEQNNGYKLSLFGKKNRPLVPHPDDQDGNQDPSIKRQPQKRQSNFLEFPRFEGTSMNGQTDTNDGGASSPSFPTIIEEQKDDQESSHYSGNGEGRDTSSTKTQEQEDDEGKSITPRIPSDNATMYMRSKYLQKLTQNRMMVPEGIEKPRTHQTIIIWDWDDTLMSSTFLSPYQPHILRQSVRKKLPKPVQAQLDHLQELIIKLLNKSVRQGATYIITNAGHGWVELSAARFLPKLYNQLLMSSKKNGIHIISARAQYEKLIPNGFKEWKYKTFHALAAKMDKDIITNIIAIGDSQIEIDAATSLQLLFKEAYVKTVKLKEQPNLVELTKQVELILSQFEEICSCAKNLTIRLQKVQDEDPSKSQNQQPPVDPMTTLHQ